MDKKLYLEYLKDESIPKRNRMFSSESKDKTEGYISIPIKIELNDILCIKDKRRAYLDNTV